MNQGNCEIGKSNPDDQPQKKPVIPLHKTYIWATVICIVLLIAIILFNEIRTTPEGPKPKADYLALLRSNHDNAIALRGIIKADQKSFQEIENQVQEQTGHVVVFPDWIPLLPSVEIIGVKISEINGDQAVSLIFKTENHIVDFLTIFNSRQEIKILESVKIEDQIFYKYKWGINRAYFWELDEDKAPIIYGVISDMEEPDLEMIATDSMRSLKTYYTRVETEANPPQTP